MTLETIDKLIEKAKLRWEINSKLMHASKRAKSPDGFEYAKGVVRYIRIVERLKKSRANYEPK